MSTSEGSPSLISCRSLSWPPVQPWLFGWLTLWGSPFRITAHPFSFSSNAADRRVEMTTRNPSDFTSRIHKVSVRVYLDGPYGASERYSFVY